MMTNYKIGNGTIIHPDSTIADGVIIGNNCRIHEGVRIGSYGSVVGRDRNRVMEINKNYEIRKGGVVIGDNVEICANTCIHKGTKTNTTIGNGVFIGAGCNIGHDVIIGQDTIILNMTCLCGWVTVGAHSYIAPGVMVINRGKIGSKATVGIGSLVLHNVPNGITVYGRPAKPKPSRKQTTPQSKQTPSKTVTPPKRATANAGRKKPTTGMALSKKKYNQWKKRR